MIIRYLLFWLPMIVIAFANATLREMVLVKQMSELKAHQVSTLTLIVLCSIYIWFVYPRLEIQNVGQAFLIGFIWVVLTVLFEFSLGRFTGKSWSILLKEYNLFEGQIWILFLFWLFISPYLCYVTRK